MKKNFLQVMLLCSLIACNKKGETSKENSDKKNQKEPELPCEVVATTPKSLETEYGCQNTKYGVHIALRDTFKLIQTTAEFNSLVTGSCLPAIDFNQYALIIGKKQLIGGNKDITYQLIRDCPNNKMKLMVTMINDLAMNAPNVTYHALVPKLNANELVEVVVQ